MLNYPAAALEYVSSDLFTSGSHALACSGARKGWVATGLLCWATICRCRAERCRPQASQLVAGRRTDVPVSSQGVQWKRHPKAKCWEQVPNSPWPRVCGSRRRQGQAGHHPSGLPNRSHLPSQYGNVALACVHVAFPICFPIQPWLDKGTTVTETSDKKQAPARCLRGGRRAHPISAHPFHCSGPAALSWGSLPRLC